MRTITILLAAATLAIPAAALAKGPPPSAKSLAIASCKAQHKDHVAYKLQYHTLGLAACVKQTLNIEHSALNAAGRQCRALKNNTDGAWDAYVSDNELASGTTFAQYFGSNTKAKGKGAGANAFGKCVSRFAKQQNAEHTSAVVSAAKQCKSDRKSDPSAFAQTYGSGKNAFGKCVSRTSKNQ